MDRAGAHSAARRCDLLGREPPARPDKIANATLFRAAIVRHAIILARKANFLQTFMAMVLAARLRCVREIVLMPARQA